MPTRLLLIEDNPGDALIFREKLNESDLDYELVHTKRLQEGLELADGDRFDLILVDLSLPDATGLEAVVQIVQAVPTRPVIVLTGLDDASIAAQARQEGAIDYLVKWYHDGQSLARYVRYAIAQKRMQSEGTFETEGQKSARRGTPDAAPTERAEEPLAASGADDVLAALEQSQEGLVVVTSDGRIRYANQRARNWIGHTSAYPWPPGPGDRLVTLPDGHGRVALHAARTSWQGQGAVLVTMRGAEDATQPAGSSDANQEIARASLSFVADSERRARWMAGLLRTAVEFEQREQRHVEPGGTTVDLVDRANMVARELHAVALERGTPIHVKASREKIAVGVDRSTLETLLRRVLLDAVLTATTAGVDLEIRLAGGQPQLVASWELSLPDWAALPADARALARSTLARLTSGAGGTWDRSEEGGRDVVTITLPSSGSVT